MDTWHSNSTTGEQCEERSVIGLSLSLVADLRHILNTFWANSLGEISRHGVQITVRGHGNPDSSHILVGQNVSVDVFILSKKLEYLQILTHK